MCSKMTKLKGLQDKFTIIIGGFNSCLLVIDKSRQVINKNIEFNKIINPQDVITVYRLLLQTRVVYTVFLSSQKTCTKINYKSGTIKRNLNKFKIIKIIWTMFSYHSEMKSEIRKITEKTPNI